MHLRVTLITSLIISGIFIALTVYSFKRCGWGMLAYNNYVIAAVTGECAQQQRLHLTAP